MKNSPKISVIIPVYNAEQFIEKTIESIRIQTEKNWELIIIDDCSTDNSLKIVKKCCTNEPRAKYVHCNQNQGESYARRKGFEISKGEYIYFLDADDLAYPDTLERLLKKLQIDNKAIVSYGYKSTNDVNKKIKYAEETNVKNIKKDLMIRCRLIPGCALIKKEYINRGDFELNLEYGEDWVFFVKLAHRGPWTYVSGKPIVEYTIHQSQQTSRNLKKINLRLKAHEIVYSDKEIIKNYTKKELIEMKKMAIALTIMYNIKLCLQKQYLITALIIMKKIINRVLFGNKVKKILI